MPGNCNASIGIDGYAIRTRLRPAIGCGSRVAAWFHENRSVFSWPPPPDFICRDDRKEKASVASPRRTFGPLVESGGNALQLRVSGDELIGCRVEPLNFLRESGD